MCLGAVERKKFGIYCKKNISALAFARGLHKEVLVMAIGMIKT